MKLNKNVSIYLQFSSVTIVFIVMIEYIDLAVVNKYIKSNQINIKNNN